MLNRQVTLLFVMENNGAYCEILQTCAAVLFGSSSNEETTSSVGGVDGTTKVVKLLVES
jgi:hypothetical protein